VELIEGRGFHVAGEPSDLLVPADLPAARQVDSVTDTEMLASAAELIAALLTDRREQAAVVEDLQRRAELAEVAEVPDIPEAGRRWLPRRGRRDATN
jgi:hypothetical protein